MTYKSLGLGALRDLDRKVLSQESQTIAFKGKRAHDKGPFAHLTDNGRAWEGKSRPRSQPTLACGSTASRVTSRAIAGPVCGRRAAGPQRADELSRRRILRPPRPCQSRWKPMAFLMPRASIFWRRSSACSTHLVLRQCEIVVQRAGPERLREQRERERMDSKVAHHEPQGRLRCEKPTEPERSLLFG
jgi:hypothetical protein